MTTTSPTTPSVPAPVPVRRKVKARYVVAALVCAAVVAWLLVVGLAKNIVYLRPVSYAVTHRAQQGTRTFRMAGQVAPGTIVQTKDGARFSMTDGNAAANVDLAGNPPDLFQNCAPVVVEGKWSGNTFMGDRLLIRHGNSYSAKDKYKIPTVRGTKCPAAASS